MGCIETLAALSRHPLKLDLLLPLGVRSLLLEKTHLLWPSKAPKMINVSQSWL